MKKLLIGVGVIVALVAAFYAFNAYIYNEKQGPADTYEGWVITTSADWGLQFHHPEVFPTTYISAVEWPPRLERVIKGYSCVPGGDVAVPGIHVEERVINGNTYCVTASSEGAAGSTYTLYEYTRDLEHSTVRASFTLKFPQCANYPEPQQAECTTERELFDVDDLVNRMFTSIQSS